MQKGAQQVTLASSLQRGAGRPRALAPRLASAARGSPGRRRASKQGLAARGPEQLLLDQGAARWL